jgi:hypothetical protein
MDQSGITGRGGGHLSGSPMCSNHPTWVPASRDSVVTEWRNEWGPRRGRSWALGAQDPAAVLTLFLPAGRVSLAQFALAFVMDTCVAGALLCGAGLLFHGMLLLRGQTTWEWARGQHSYDLGLCHNLQAALGPRWVLVWLWPFLASPLPGDGITFQTKAGTLPDSRRSQN